ncbi:MAG: DUF2304 domain-containing protein [Phycisphaerales bacterium]|nr:DUF2304 domain-containing protein [Phycisphaerales bacterium]
MRPLQYILLLIGAGLLLMAVKRLGKYRLKERYTLVFMFIGLPFLVLAFWPDAISTIAKKLDIQYHTLIILCVCAFFLIIFLELLTIVSIQDRKISNLTQIVAILMSDTENAGSSEPAAQPPSADPPASMRLEDHRGDRPDAHPAPNDPID